ncbi:MAG: ExeA family protein [bacterium]
MNILEYGVVSEAGITIISGEVGTGKTTLIRSLQDQLDEYTTVGLITNTQSDFGDLIKWVLISYGVESKETDHVRLYQHLVDFITAEYESNRRVLLIIDEAQNLGAAALEDLRMLTNININKQPVLQLILVGQPELIEILKKKDLRQFAQRVSADYVLQPLSFSETKSYIEHRIKVAGGAENLFAPTAFATVYYHSGGLPRIINTICDMALVYGFADEAPRIRKEIVLEAIRDRKVGGLAVRDDLEINKEAEILRQQVIDKTGIDIADVDS